MPHAFISYVSEDQPEVAYFVDILKRNGVEVWIDKERIRPGERWRDAIRTAIREGAFFLPLFSRAWAARERTEANEEVLIAIEELRKMPRAASWFVPIRLDRCDIPEIPIGPAETIRDIQYVDVGALGWAESMRRLLAVLGVADPVLPMREPLGAGLPNQAEVFGGRLRFIDCQPPIPLMRDLVFYVAGGWLERVEGLGIRAYLKSDAPNAELQRVNEALGLDCFHATCDDQTLSTDPGRPNIFQFSQEIILPAGTPLPDLMTGQLIHFPADIRALTEYSGRGALLDHTFSGTFEVDYLISFGAAEIPVHLTGTFDLSVRPTEYAPGRVPSA